MNDKILITLKKIGLNTNETKIYLDLLKNPNSSVSEISKRTRLYKSNIYECINNLEMKTIVIRNLSTDKKTFNTIKPEGLINILKEKEKEIETIIPLLEELKSEQWSENNIRVFNGVQEIIEGIKNCNKKSEEILLLYPINEDINVHEYDIIKAFHEFRNKFKIKLKVIFSKKSKRFSEISKYQFVESRYIETNAQNHEIRCSTFVHGENMFIINYSEPINVIKISNKNLTDSFRMTFKALWETAKKD